MADEKPAKFTTITDAGVQLIDQLAAKSNTITAFRAVASSAPHWNDSLDDIRAMTDIDSVEQTGQYMGNFNQGTTTETVQIDFNQQELKASYELATVGLFATDGNNKEILYAVECLQESQAMTPSPEHDVNTHNIKIVVGNTSQVTAEFSDADVVSQAAFQANLAAYTKTVDLPKLIADNIPKDIAFTDKPNTFSEQQTFSAGAVDGKGNAYITKDEVPNPDLTGLQPKGDYATHADVNSSLAAYTKTELLNQTLKLLDTTTDVDAKLAKKVTDNGDGTEQLSGKKIQPFNAIPTVIAAGTNIDSLQTTGNYFIEGVTGVTNLPGNGTTWTNILVLRGDSSNGSQLAINSNTGAMSVRGWSSDTKYTAWFALATSNDVNAAKQAAITQADNDTNTKLANYVGINPSTSQVTNHTVKFNDGQLIVNTQPVVTLAGAADPDEATAKTKSSDGLLHYTIES
ncbi:pyocin knob domain-containing protein [Secundilactobacillus yichangensis]|uniref:pyocin knob domain-containing protein n=1 Tax=Secundilactobacillus yichangensis TaxID=2799580 RepID=UPI00194374B8|nr:pyocin knob domain-containing protein [Secundilactobacillus yichangensis]